MDWKIYALLFLTVAPIFWGFGMWIYGKVKNKKKIRHNGFIMMMLSFLLIFLVIFTIGATLFYLYLNAGTGNPSLSGSGSAESGLSSSAASYVWDGAAPGSSASVADSAADSGSSVSD